MLIFIKLKKSRKYFWTNILEIEMHILCVALTLIINIFVRKKQRRLHFWQKDVSY